MGSVPGARCAAAGKSCGPGSRSRMARHPCWSASDETEKEGVSMDEQSRQVLQLLAEGKVTAEEAERLINALERVQPDSPAGGASRPKSRPKYLRVLVNADGDGDDDGPSRVNIRVPFQLLRGGVRLN